MRPIKKIVFIEPKAPGFHVYSKWGLPRLGPILLGTILEKAGYDVSVFVEGIKGIDFDAVLDADAVGISTTTSTAPRAYAIADAVRKAGIPVFMGGAHVTFLAEEALTHCDYVLRGEADETILDFIRAMESGKGIENIAGLTYKKGHHIVHNPQGSHCMDLDRLPMPNLDLIRGTQYTKASRAVTPIITSRGCPFACNFCSVTEMFGRKYRFRSTENVMEELRLRRPTWVFFYDDNFCANPLRTKELLRTMIRKKITPRWMAQVRIDVAKDPELLDLMRASNCSYLYIGLESINPETLRALQKNQTPEEIEDAIRIIQSYGIKIHGMFIFGADYDNIKTIRKTVRFAKKTGLSSTQFMILTPLPGTEVFKNMESEGRLLSRDWGYYDAHHVVFTPKRMSFLELQKETAKAMLKFYSFRRIISRLICFDIWTMLIRAYGRRYMRRWRRNNADFFKHMAELYQQAKGGLNAAGHTLQFRANKTTEDLKEFFKGINIEHIRRLKEEKLRRFRQERGIL